MFSDERNFKPVASFEDFALKVRSSGRGRPALAALVEFQK
jgi:hypothetical protein